MQGPHFHRCKECREKMEPGCVDPICREGLLCYERMVDRIEHLAMGVAW